MKIAILGAGGQLGQDLREILGAEAVPLTRADADLTRPEQLRAALTALRPEVVVNCAAYNLVDKAETEPAAAFAVNTLGVRNLAVVCRDLNCTLAHFSTDYVFGLDDARAEPYREDDCPGPVSVYGSSKAAGEDFVRSLCPRHFVVRTCGLYGHKGIGGKGGNFVETMLRKATEGAKLRVVADQRCTPTASADLAHAAALLIRTQAYGLYHFTNAEACSWFEFARAIFDLSGRSADLVPITSAEFGAPARRPRYSVLACDRYDGLGLAPRARWEEALRVYLAGRR
jgi:dTDP-4-dehydrorhamnose reductase